MGHGTVHSGWAEWARQVNFQACPYPHPPHCGQASHTFTQKQDDILCWSSPSHACVCLLLAPKHSAHIFACATACNNFPHQVPHLETGTAACRGGHHTFCTHLQHGRHCLACLFGVWLGLPTCHNQCVTCSCSSCGSSSQARSLPSAS